MDLSSILSSLSEDDMKKLKETAQQFFGSSEQEEKEPEQSKNDNKLQFPEFDPKMLTSVAKFSSMMKQSDERCDFLMALKPLLSEKRRKKADDAIMMLKFMKIINLLQENGI